MCIFFIHQGSCDTTCHGDWSRQEVKGQCTCTHVFCAVKTGDHVLLPVCLIGIMGTEDHLLSIDAQQMIHSAHDGNQPYVVHGLEAGPAEEALMRVPPDFHAPCIPIVACVCLGRSVEGYKVLLWCKRKLPFPFEAVGPLL